MMNSNEKLNIAFKLYREVAEICLKCRRRTATGTLTEECPLSCGALKAKSNADEILAAMPN